MESFKELREFKPIRDAESELKFTELLKHIYHRHRQASEVQLNKFPHTSSLSLYSATSCGTHTVVYMTVMFQHCRNVVPVMAIGVAELKRELSAAGNGLTEFPEIHQFLDGFYLSRIGIRILIGQHIALHEPQRENHIGASTLPTPARNMQYVVNCMHGADA